MSGARAQIQRDYRSRRYRGLMCVDFEVDADILNALVATKFLPAEDVRNRKAIAAALRKLVKATIK